MALDTDLSRKIKNILTSVRPLPPEATSPILHYRRSSNEFIHTLEDTRKAFASSDFSRAIQDNRVRRLRFLTVIGVIQTFERFLKEVAAESVDCVARYIVDDRFNTFRIQASTLAAHFDAGTLGRSMCESAVWLDCEEINDRFRKILSDPFQGGGPFFYLFPKPGQQPEADRWRFETMNLIWQLRHTAVHNVGVLTPSDAVKLSGWTHEPVASGAVLTPSHLDMVYLKSFLDDTAEMCNRRIGDRLAELLTLLQTRAPAFASAQDLADRVSNLFQRILVVGGATGVLPPI